ncbi:MAG: formate dehydrogenase subunit gamma [Alphaproteobacteria bacterium]|nr:formate dehydrogenase subunit gamma [Alphaproteobacteria bacterium]
MTAKSRFGFSAVLTAMLVAVMLALATDVQAQSKPNVRPPEGAQQWGGPAQVPTTVLPQPSDALMWRNIRRGVVGTVSIPDKQAGQLVQSDGEAFRSWRNGPISVWGGWSLLAILVITGLFYALRGRIRIDAGPSNKQIERFNGVERFAHWLMAGSFIILALTGLNMLYGRYVLLPVLGPDIFALLTQAGKYAHNYLSFAFMIGVVMAFVLWVRHNIPNKHDFVWLAKAGGLFSKNVHPPAKKFNAGQKFIFWSVVIGGVSISLSGIMLLFPFEMKMFGATFAIINVFGFGLETDLTLLQEMQLAQIWHTVVGLILIVIIIGHIYIGSLGMEGAFDAMGSGMVDENWAKEHHNLWVAEMEAARAPRK